MGKTQNGHNILNLGKMMNSPKPFLTLLVILGLIIIPSVLPAQSTEERARAEYFFAEDQYNAKQYKSAIEHLDKAIGILGSANPRIQEMKVKSYYALKDYKSARKEIQAYFSLSPDQSANEYREMLKLSVTLEDEVEKLVQTETYRKHRQAGDRLLSQKNYDSAITEYRAALQNKPGDSYVTGRISKANRDQENDRLYRRHRASGDRQYNQKNWTAAKEQYSQALRYNTNDSYTQNRINRINQTLRLSQYETFKQAGDRNYSNGNWSRAIEQYRQALRFKSNDTYVRERIKRSETELYYPRYKSEGDALFSKGQYKEAISKYRTAHKYNSGDSYTTEKIAEAQRIINTQNARRKQREAVAERSRRAREAEERRQIARNMKIERLVWGTGNAEMAIGLSYEPHTLMARMIFVHSLGLNYAIGQTVTDMTETIVYGGDLRMSLFDGGGMYFAIGYYVGSSEMNESYYRELRSRPEGDVELPTLSLTNFTVSWGWHAVLGAIYIDARYQVAMMAYATDEEYGSNTSVEADGLSVGLGIVF